MQVAEFIFTTLTAVAILYSNDKNIKKEIRHKALLITV